MTYRTFIDYKCSLFNMNASVLPDAEQNKFDRTFLKVWRGRADESREEQQFVF